MYSQDWREYPVEQDEAKNDVNFGPPRRHKRTADPRDLGPIKRQNAHPQAATDTEELIDGHVLGSDPADPTEHAERREKVAR